MWKNKRFILTECLLIILISVFFLADRKLIPRQYAANATVQVTVNPSTQILTVPPQFPGMGLETFSICAVNQLAKSSAFINLFKNLGPAILRFGGETGDFATWSPTGTLSCPYNATVLTRSALDQVFAFARSAGIQLFWTVNLKVRDPATYADEAAYAVTTGGNALYALQIGNEPDLFGWGYATFKSAFDSYAAAIKAKAPNAPLSGPAFCCEDSEFAPFITSENLITATQHLYYFDPGQSPSPQGLLDPTVNKNSLSRLDGFVSAAKSRGIPLHLDETNSLVDVQVPSGQTFAQTLWVADYALATMEHGVAGINIFGQIPIDGTSPINDNGIPRVSYYGLLFFHEAAAGNGKVVKTTVTTSNNVTAYSIIDPDGKLHVAIINKDTTDASVQINTTQAYAQATAIRLTAPSLSATSGITLGGASVAADGTWHPTTEETVPLTGTVSSVTVPAASGAIITYQNASNPTSPPSISPSSSQAQTGVQFAITICPHGLGNCGDNVNPNSGGNANPMHHTRIVTLTILDSTGKPVTSAQGTVTYNQSAQNFQGIISVPMLTSGQYVVSLKMDEFLSHQVTGIVSVSSVSQSITLPAVSVITGDINNDNQLDLLDYNILISCFGLKQTTSSCTNSPTTQSPGADITDDGLVDGIDYNVFLRELSVQHSE